MRSRGHPGRRIRNRRRRNGRRGGQSEQREPQEEQADQAVHQKLPRCLAVSTGRLEAGTMSSTATFHTPPAGRITR